MYKSLRNPLFSLYVAVESPLLLESRIMFAFLTILAIAAVCSDGRRSSSNKVDDLGLFLPGQEVLVRKAGDKAPVLITHLPFPKLDLSDNGEASFARLEKAVADLGESKFVTTEVAGDGRAMYDTILLADEACDNVKKAYKAVSVFTNTNHTVGNLTIHKGCTGTLENLDLDSKVEGMLELMEIVKTSLADIEAKYSSTPAGVVTAEEKAKAIQHTQTEMNSLLFSLDSILIPLVIRRNMLDSASNDIADSYLLGEIDALKCVSSGQHEHTDVMGMEKGKDKVAILLSVSQLSEPDFFHRVL